MGITFEPLRYMYFKMEFNHLKADKNIFFNENFRNSIQFNAGYALF